MILSLPLLTTTLMITINICRSHHPFHPTRSPHPSPPSSPLLFSPTSPHYRAMAKEVTTYGDTDRRITMGARSMSTKTAMAQAKTIHRSKKRRHSFPGNAYTVGKYVIIYCLHRPPFLAISGHSSPCITMHILSFACLLINHLFPICLSLSIHHFTSLGMEMSEFLRNSSNGGF